MTTITIVKLSSLWAYDQKANGVTASHVPVEYRGFSFAEDAERFVSQVNNDTDSDARAEIIPCAPAGAFVESADHLYC